MLSRTLLLTFAVPAVIAVGMGCGNHPASDSVKAFTIALSDSSWSDAWQMLTPGTQAAWDSTAAVIHRFGYTESAEFLAGLSAPVTEEEFADLNGELLFIRMVEDAPEIADLSSSVRGVELADSATALVTIATSQGSQIIPVKQVGNRWLLDLTTLTPPPEALETQTDLD
ncbi:MAG: hypothetical protein KAH54_08925 [Candidatus Sabulitectum sp.]|nr:hypothetical protein [Candidatus Sabulitectum sp.]